MDSEKLNRFLFPALTSMLLLSEPRLSRRIIWNLSGFTIILFLWRQLIAASHSDSKIDSNSLSVHAKLAKVLSSAKLWTEAFGIKKKKWLKKKKKNWSENWALGYTWYDCVKLTLQYSLFIWTHCLRFFLNNRCSKANHYLDHMLRVLRSVSRVLCSQNL